MPSITKTPPREQHECYEVITVCIEDFAWELESRKDDALADDEWVSEARDDLEFVKTLSEDEWRYVAELISDYLWSEGFSETLQNARGYAITRIKKLRAGTDGPL